LPQKQRQAVNRQRLTEKPHIPAKESILLD